MKRHVLTACLYTVITAVLLGLVYPLVIAGVARLIFHDKAEGQLLTRNGEITGSRLIGQPFVSPRYFHGRPSAAGSGYDGSASSGSNLSATSRALADRVQGSVQAEGTGGPVPIDLVTASGSGLDPDISPASALYQVARVAKIRLLPEDRVRQLVLGQVKPRQFGLLGEPTVNVRSLNEALDALGAREGR